MTQTYPRLTQDISVDVAIIGGGITGLLNAYFLAKAGKRVALVEADEVGSGATAATTACITEVIDSDLSQIVDIFGEDTAVSVWRSGQQAIDQLERLITEESIDCAFVRCPNYFFAGTKRQAAYLEEEFQHYQALGLEASFHADGADLAIPNAGYLAVPRQAKFHAGTFMASLVGVLQKQGVQIFEHTKALNVSGTAPVRIATSGGTITAQDVIVATYLPLLHTGTRFKKGMYRSYVLKVELPKGVLREGLYEDSGNPYHYFRVDRGETMDEMLFGGEDHRDMFGSILKKKSFAALEKALRALLPHVDYTIRARWSGRILEPSDGLPLIGSIKPNYYVATAFSGNGMTYSVISAILLRDLILGKEHPWAKIYDPRRAFTLKRLIAKAKDYTGEFFGGAFKNLFS